MFVAAMLLALPVAQAQDADHRALTGAHARKQFISGSDVRVSANVSNDIFAAGGKVGFRGASAADIFAAGGEVSFDATDAGRIVAAGGQLRYSGTRVGDLITAGGDVDIGAQVGGDLIAAGGSVHILPSAAVGGDALLAGGEISIDGPVAGDVRARGGKIRIGGDVGGDVRLAGGEIVVEAGARIAGDLTYVSARPADIAAGSVGGEIVRGEGRTLPRLGIWARIGAFLGLALAALVLYGTTPTMLDGAVDRLVARPGASLGIGVLVFVGFPLAAILLTITLIGIPLAILVGALYFAGFVPAYVTMGAWAGGRLARLSRKAPVLWAEDFFWILVGLAALISLSAIPVVGAIVAAAALLFGLGALTLQFWGRTP